MFNKKYVEKQNLVIYAQPFHFFFLFEIELDMLELWKQGLSHIDKIKGLEHVYKFTSYSIHCRLILGWNFIWAYKHGSLFKAQFL